MIEKKTGPNYDDTANTQTGQREHNDDNNQSVLNVAKYYLQSGLSVIPAALSRQDINMKKKPWNYSTGQLLRWKSFQNGPMDEKTFCMVFGSDPEAVAIITGKASGSLEILDFDQAGVHFDSWKSLIPEDLYKSLVVEQSPSGGFHVGYRCENAGGNTTLAQDAQGHKTIETRGEGGYCLVFPSPGYQLIQGNWLTPSIISEERRSILLDTAKSLDERPVKPVKLAPKNKPTKFDTVFENIKQDQKTERARKYLDNTEPAISGEKGSNKTILVATAIKYGFCLDDQTTLQLLESWNSRCVPPWTEKELIHKIEDATCPHDKEPGWLLNEQRRNDVTNPTKSDNISDFSDEKAKKKRITMLCADEIEIKPVQWLWNRRIQSGAINILYGKQGSGKSFLAYKIASIVSRGNQWPFNEGQAPIGRVIFLDSGEDPPEIIGKPRLIEAEANLSNIFFVQGITSQHKEIEERIKLTKNNASLLREEISNLTNQGGVPVRLIIIDPLNRFWDNTNPNSASEVSQAFQPFSDLAKDFDIAVLIIHHPKKGLHDSAIDSASGSEAITSYARVAWKVTQDRNKVIKCGSSKMNNAEPAKSFTYTIENGISVGKLVWGEYTEGTAEDFQEDEFKDFMGRRKAGRPFGTDKKRNEAKEFLKTLLSDAPHLVGNEKAPEPGTIRHEVAMAGYSWGTVRNAAKDLVKKYRAPDGNGYYWELLPDDQK